MSTTGFEHLLDYRLLRGAHPFPGPAGGACVNEAAIVAAGLDYRAIGCAQDCPPCFSRPIAAFAIALNDHAEDEERQALKRFVLRLAGTADDLDIEAARARHAVFDAARVLFGGSPETFTDCRRLVSGHHETVRGSMRVALTFAESGDSVEAARWAAIALDSAEARFQDRVSILEGMLAIGRQAPAVDSASALTRLTATFGAATRQAEQVPA